jgi:hypothetical protein
VLPKEWNSFTVTVTLLIPMQEWDVKQALALHKALTDVSGCASCRLRVVFPIQHKPAKPPSFDGGLLWQRGATTAGGCSRRREHHAWRRAAARAANTLCAHRHS